MPTKETKTDTRTVEQAIMESLNGPVQEPVNKPSVPVAQDGMRITIVKGKNGLETPWLD